MARRGLFGFFIFRERIAFQLGLQGAFGRDRGECLPTLLGQSDQCLRTQDQDTMENVRVKSEFCPPPTCVLSMGAVLNPRGPTRQHPSAQSSDRDEATSYGSDADTTMAQRANIPQPRANALGLPRRPIGGLSGRDLVCVVRRTILLRTVGARDFNRHRPRALPHKC